MGFVTGCNLDPPANRGRSASPTLAADPDTALVAQVMADLTDAAGLAAATAAKHPGLKAMGNLSALHVAHAAVLGTTLGADFAHAGGIPGTAQALVQVRRHETRLQRRLADRSVAAASGDLARVLASMSAAVAQALAQLPPSKSGAAS